MFSKKHKILFGVALFFIGGILYLFLFSSWARVQSVRVEGAESVPREEIERVVREEMAERALGIFPRDTGALFPGEDVRAALYGAFPRIREIYLAENFPKEVAVRVEEREIEGIWCGGGTCAFFDDAGVIFDDAPASTRGFLLFQVMDDRARASVPELGDDVLTEEDVSFLSFLRESIALRKLPALRYRIVSDGEVHVEFQGGWRALFSRSDNPIYQVEVLNRVLKKEIASDLPLLDYVDLRVKNKVFYSFEE